MFAWKDENTERESYKGEGRGGRGGGGIGWSGREECVWERALQKKLLLEKQAISLPRPFPGPRRSLKLQEPQRNEQSCDEN